MSKKEIEKELYTLPEAGYALAHTVNGIRRLMWQGKLKYVQCGKKIFVSRKEIASFIERNTHQEKN